jgi:hypothetical protein
MQSDSVVVVAIKRLMLFLGVVLALCFCASWDIADSIHADRAAIVESGRCKPSNFRHLPLWASFLNRSINKRFDIQ